MGLEGDLDGSGICAISCLRHLCWSPLLPASSLILTRFKLLPVLLLVLSTLLCLPSISMPLPLLRHSKSPSAPSNSTPLPEWPSGPLIRCGAFILVLHFLLMISGCFLLYPAPSIAFPRSRSTSTPFGSPYTSKHPPGPVSWHGAFIPSLCSFWMPSGCSWPLWTLPGTSISLPGLSGSTWAPSGESSVPFLFEHPLTCFDALCSFLRLLWISLMHTDTPDMCTSPLGLPWLSRPPSGDLVYSHSSHKHNKLPLLDIRFRQVQTSSNQFGCTCPVPNLNLNLENRGWTELKPNLNLRIQFGGSGSNLGFKLNFSNPSLHPFPNTFNPKSTTMPKKTHFQTEKSLDDSRHERQRHVARDRQFHHPQEYLVLGWRKKRAGSHVQGTVQVVFNFLCPALHLTRVVRTRRLAQIDASTQPPSKPTNNKALHKKDTTSDNKPDCMYTMTNDLLTNNKDMKYINPAPTFRRNMMESLRMRQDTTQRASKTTIVPPMRKRTMQVLTSDVIHSTY